MNNANRRYKRYRSKETLKLILSITLFLIGLAGIIYAIVMQAVLCYEKFGVIISSDAIIIPHLSLLGYLGVIPMGIGFIVFMS